MSIDPRGGALCSFGSNDIAGTQAVFVPDHGELIDLRELLKEQLALSDGNHKVAAVRVRDICLLRVIIPADKGGDVE